MNPQVWWFVSRSSGMIAWALLTLSVCWGLFISTKAVAKASSPAWLLDLHRYGPAYRAFEDLQVI